MPCYRCNWIVCFYRSDNFFTLTLLWARSSKCPIKWMLHASWITRFKISKTIQYIVILWTCQGIEAQISALTLINWIKQRISCFSIFVISIRLTADSIERVHTNTYRAPCEWHEKNLKKYLNNLNTGVLRSCHFGLVRTHSELHSFVILILIQTDQQSSIWYSAKDKSHLTNQ